MYEIAQLTRVLQLSITPVTLLSGVGVLLWSMTNRLGRVIDRSRDVAEGLSTGRSDAAVAELRILMRRAELLLYAIGSIATSIFLVVIMVIVLFVMHFLGVDLSDVILGLFAVCLVGLVVSIACFVGDVLLGIRWLHLSLDHYMTKGPARER